MDREAAVIRSEMSQTRAQLDRKITELEARVHELTPRAVAKRYLPENAMDYAIGGILTLVGTRMAWRRLRGATSNHSDELRTMVIDGRSW
jgi:hypothetical protein